MGTSQATETHPMRIALCRLRPEHALWLAAIVTLIIYIHVFSIAPLSGEDFALTRDFNGVDWLARLQWIILRAHQQITGWNARLGEQLAIFWLSMPKAWFTLFSTATFAAFAYLISTLFGTTEGARRRTLLALAFVFVIWPGMEVFFWGTATAEYLQPLIPCLFCLRCYANDLHIERLHASSWLFIAVTLAAILGGLSFENIPIAIIGYMVFSLANAKKASLSYRTLLPVAGMGAGWLTLITAPSTRHRREFYKEMYKVKGYSLDYIISRGSDVLTTFYTTTWLLAGLAILSAAVVLWHSNDRKRYLGMVFVAILVVASLVAAPYTEPRAFNLAWAIMFATVVSAIDLLTLRFRILNAIVCVAAIFGIYFGLLTASYYSGFARLSNERHYFIEAQIHTPACQQGIEVSAVDDLYPYRYINNRNNWYRANPAYISQFYGCQVRIK